MAELFKKFLGAMSEAPLNGFDLSSREVFSAKVGQEIPAKCIFTIPRGEYEIDVRSLCRSAQPLQTTAFTRFDMQYEFYRVHINDLFSNFNQKIAMRQDEQVSLHTPFDSSFPCFHYKDFVQNLILACIYDYMCDNPVIFVKDNFQVTVYPDTVNPAYNVRPGAIKYFYYSPNQPFESLSLSALRALDMYGYGNLLPTLKTLYAAFCKYVENVVYDDYHPFENKIDYIQYDDIFNFVSSSGTLDTYYTYAQFWTACFSGIPEDFLCNLWLPLAYNKVFSEEYRNPYYDFDYSIRSNAYGSIANFDYVQLFNLDDKPEMYTPFDASDPFGNDFLRMLGIFALKFRPYGKDMFNGVLPSTQFGDISVMTTDNEYYEIIAKSYNSSTDRNLSVAHSTGNVFNMISSSDSNAKYKFNPAIAISVLEQRRADALQKFNENRLRAGNRTSSNFIAHFGVAPKSEPHHSVSFLGSFDGSIELNQVAATNTSSSNDLGQLVSNGVGVVQGSKIRYKTDDFDIILCLLSISKPSEYDAYGMNRELQILDPWDYPYSELQNISLKPLDRITYNVFDGSLPRVLGYLPAFIEKKTDVDRVHGEFFTGIPSFPANNENFVIPSGIFSPYVTPRDMKYSPDTNGFLYISPDSVDNVFEMRVDSTQATDQFLFNVLFDIKAVQPLSVLGLPK